MKLGLDELIIVNPGSPPGDTTHGKPAQTWFLGADGGLYRLDHAVNDGALGNAEPVPRFFLGDDGIVYETR